MNTSSYHQRQAAYHVAMRAYQGMKNGDNVVDVILDAVLAEVAKHNTPDKPVYFKMSERKPTKEDAKPSGRVLGYNPEERCWYAVGYEAASGAYDFWMPMPDKPISDDESAFGCILRSGPPSTLGVNKHTFYGMDVRALRYVWDAALAHRDKSKP